jgi:hypothetical protein
MPEVRKFWGKHFLYYRSDIRKIWHFWIPNNCHCVHSVEKTFKSVKNITEEKSYPCNRPWRPLALWDVEAPTFSRHSAHRWRWGCQPYAPAALCPQEDSWHLFLLEAESTPGHSAAGMIRSIEKSNDLIGNLTRDLPTCSIVIQTTTLPRGPPWSSMRWYNGRIYKTTLEESTCYENWNDFHERRYYTD